MIEQKRLNGKTSGQVQINKFVEVDSIIKVRLRVPLIVKVTVAKIVEVRESVRLFVTVRVAETMGVIAILKANSDSENHSESDGDSNSDIVTVAV